MTLQRLSFKKTTRGLCLGIRAAELKPLIGARQSGVTGQAEELSENIIAYYEIEEVFQGGACAR